MSNEAKNIPGTELKAEDFVLVNQDERLLDAAFSTKPVVFFGDVLSRLVRNKAAVSAFVLIALIALMAVFGPSMNQYGYNEQNAAYVNLPPKIPGLEKLGIADGGRMLYNRRGGLPR